MINIFQCNYKYLEKYNDLFLNDNIFLSPNYYNNSFKIKSSFYFGAFLDTKLIGVSAMSEVVWGGKDSIYHRAAWVHPSHRRQGTWKSLMNYKVLFLKTFFDQKKDQTHFVYVSTDDCRYKNNNWTFYDRTIQLVDGKQILRNIWYTSWNQLNCNSIE